MLSIVINNYVCRLDWWLKFSGGGVGRLSDSR